MRFFIFICCLFTILAQGLAAPMPESYREITVSGTSGNIRSCASLTFFIPDDVKGYRLIDAGGQERGLTALMRQGSCVNAFFNAAPGEKLRMEFYPETVKQKNAEQTSGLLHLVKRFNNDTVVNSVEDFRELWNNSGLAVGGFTSRVYAGVNPYSKNMNSAHIYKGFITIPENGEYIFYTASTDASFLLIDDKAIAAWPGCHGVGEGLYGAYNGTIKLTKGIHRFEYLHSNSQWGYYAIAAFSRPNDKNMTIIPEKMFTPVLAATQGPLFNMQDQPLPDFTWENTATLEVEKLQTYRVICKPANASGLIKWNWGDRTSPGTSSNCHYYFKPGKYSAEMESVNGRSTQQIELAYNPNPQMINDNEAEKMVDEALEQEKTTGIQVEGYAFIVNAILQYKMKRQAVDFYARVMQKHNLIPPAVILNYFQELILEEMLKSEKYEDAEEEFKRFIARIKDEKCLALAKLEYARLLFYCMGRTGDSEKQFSEIDRKFIPFESKMQFDILQADLALFSKGFDEASQMYDRMSSTGKKIDRQQKIMAGGMIISIRNCLVMKKYDEAMSYIERLESWQPEVRLNPDLTLIKAKALENMEMPRRAAVCYETVLKLNPPVSTAAAANLNLAEYYCKSAQYGKVREYLNAIRNEAPRSHEAVSAGKILNEIDRKEGKL
ncbi:MAG: hypothetical protein ACYC4Q_07875 [Victivallaceae bacterium]